MGARLLASVSLGLLGVPVVAAPPLSAHEAHMDFQWLEPDQDSDVSGPAARIRAHAAFPEGVDRWSLEVVSPSGSRDTTGNSYGFVCQGQNQSRDSGDGAVQIDCAWDTTTYPQGSIAPNGEQLLRLTVWERDTGQTTPQPHVAPLRRVVVANPPMPPAGLSLAHPEGSREVALAWEPSPEPDVTHYVVEQRVDNGDWETVAEPKSPSWKGRLGRPGTYEYRVAAARPAGSGSRILKSRFTAPEPASTTLGAVTERPTDEAIGSSGGGETGAPAPAPRSPATDADPGARAVASPSSPAVAPGRLDVRYQLDPRLQRSPTRPPAGRAPEPDSWFSQRLPYAAPESAAPGIAAGDRGRSSAQVTMPEGQGSPPPNPLVFPAGALVAFVAAMLGLHAVRRPQPGVPMPGDWD